jgi:hydroxyacylglutathione hydrolase
MPAAPLPTGGASRERGDAVHIVRLPLWRSNGYLLRGPAPGARLVLVDPGSPTAGDSARLAASLAQAGLGFRDIALIVLTHGHADHAGNAARVRRASGAPVVAGRGDAAMLRAGRNDVLHPMGMEARMIRPMLTNRYPPLAADVWVAEAPPDAPAGADSLDLRPYGIAGAVVSMPGHTAGSLAIFLASGDAVVGDLLRGGLLGGRIAARRPAVHYFHADRARATVQICVSLARGVTRFYLGHGGPIERAAVERRFGRACGDRARAGR